MILMVDTISTKEEDALPEALDTKPTNAEAVVLKEEEAAKARAFDEFAKTLNLFPKTRGIPASLTGSCPICKRRIIKGEEIGNYGRCGWVHTCCKNTALYHTVRKRQEAALQGIDLDASSRLEALKGRLEIEGNPAITIKVKTPALDDFLKRR